MSEATQERKELIPSEAGVSVDALVRPGIAKYECNACGKIVQRDMGWKLWTFGFCKTTGTNARLYRISVPSKTNANRVSLPLSDGVTDGHGASDADLD